MIKKIVLMVCVCTSVFATTIYVDIDSLNPTPPYNSPLTAAHNIQDGVDWATDGDTVLVADGHYVLNSQIEVSHDITVVSENGLESTIVDGNGSSRCFFLDAACLISCFTITNGYALAGDGGGVYCKYSSGRDTVVSNCEIIGNMTDHYGGGMYGGTMNNCTFFNNSAKAGGGGSQSGTANNCVFSNNVCIINGGGKSHGAANNCLFISNSTIEWNGGGGSNIEANNCRFISNYSGKDGGGMFSGIANNCLVFSNSARYRGGATYGSTLNNSVIYGNTVTYSSRSAGIAYGTAHNCIISKNLANGTEYNYNTSANLYYCCSPGLVTNDARHNISSDPLFVDADSSNFRLQSSSPCIDAGFNDYAPSGSDLDGNPRIMGVAVDMGAYEFPQGNHYTIIASAGSHGSVSPSGAVNVYEGASIPFSITPDSYYDTADVLTNSISLGLAGATSFAWENITANGSLDVIFTARTATNNVPEWWLAYYGWTDNFDEASLSDTDGDGYEAWREYTLGTDPADRSSSLNFEARLDAGAYRLQFDGVLERFYTMEFSSSLTADDWKEYFSLGNVNGTIYFSDYNITSNRFYRMKVDWLE